MKLPPTLLCSILICLTCLVAFTTASPGDGSLGFRNCLGQCTLGCTESDSIRDELAKLHAGKRYNLDRYVPTPESIAENKWSEQDVKLQTVKKAQEQFQQLTSWRTFFLWATYWTCEDNCKYTCMQEQTAEMIASGRDVVKFYGKWPFIRVMGAQEFGSTLFSIFNFVPFFHFFFHLADQLPDTFWMKPIWYGYTISGMNTWIWSTAFHARDNIYTERLDYFCATFSILYLLNIAIIRILRLKQSLWICTIAPSLIYFAWHCYTLHYIHFDYDWNMEMMILFGGSYCMLWYVWAFFNPAATHRWKICVANTIILLMSLCEIFDFPPIWLLFDAHSIWHFSTPICSYLTFSFAIDDAQYLHKLEMERD